MYSAKASVKLVSDGARLSHMVWMPRRQYGHSTAGDRWSHRHPLPGEYRPPRLPHLL